MRRPADLLRPVRRAVLARRRLLAALLTAAAVAAGLQAAAAPPPAEVAVLVAARDLPSGTVLGADDLRTTGFAPGSVPEGVVDTVDTAAGRTLAAPLRAGEPVTDVRLVGPALTEGYPGLTAVPVRLPDPGVAGLLAVGDLVDLVATDPEGGAASVVADDAPVLALPTDDGAAGATGLGGRLVVLGVPPSGVPLVADASARTFLSIALAG